MKSLFNNNPRKGLLMAIVGTLLASTSWGQTFVWQIQPTDYTQVKGLGAELLQVFRGNRFGLLRTDGTEVAPIEFDEMTGFYEHKALLLKSESGKQRIGGYVTDAGRFVPFQQAYFTLNGQAFFSDGMLSVSDERGRLGYVNESGVAAVGFNGKYTKIKPFTEGYAAVFEGKRYALIDKEGDEAKFIIGFGEVHGGTNVCNGYAMIWDTDGNFYRYETSSKKCMESRKPRDLHLDYLYCLASISGRTKDVPFVQPAAVKETSAFAMMPNGKFGAMEADRQLLPGQFTAVSALSEDLFIVNLDGKYGLLRKVSGGNAFKVSIPKKEVSYKVGSNAQCMFELVTPEAWSSKDLDVSIQNKLSGESFKGALKDGQYSFNFRPNGAEQTFSVRVHSEGLLLLDESLTYTFKRIETSLKVSLSISGNIANKDDQIPVTATITNPSDDSVTATVHMTGSETFVEKHVTVTIPAGGTEHVHSHFHVTKDVSNQSVQVTTTKGGSASRAGLSFESYY